MTRQRAKLIALETAAAIVPTYNEAGNIGRTVRALQRVPGLDEILVVDGHSQDSTVQEAEAAGARVVEQRRPMHPGKGIALETGIAATDSDVVLLFDADLSNVSPAMPQRLLEPVLDGRADHTVGCYRRRAGRVTELTVKPMLELLFPEVRFQQPLAGEYAFRRRALQELRLEPGWGVEVGLVIDSVMQGLRSEEVDLGFKDHPMKSLEELRPMARQVAETVLRKAAAYGRLVPVTEGAFDAATPEFDPPPERV